MSRCILILCLLCLAASSPPYPDPSPDAFQDVMHVTHDAAALYRRLWAERGAAALIARLERHITEQPREGAAERCVRHRELLANPNAEGPRCLSQALFEEHSKAVPFRDYTAGPVVYGEPSDALTLISSRKYYELSDATIGRTPLEEITNRSLVFVNALSSSRMGYLKDVLPKLGVSIFLIHCAAHQHFEDWVLDSPAVIRLLACNVPYELRKHPKVRIVPLGLKPLALKFLSQWREKLAKTPLKQKVFAQFSIRTPATRAKFRKQLLHDLQARGVIKIDGPYQRMTPEVYVKNMVTRRFILCPKGLGPDTFRAWEALSVGRVPVVERMIHPFVFEGLPVLQIESWDDFNHSLMDREWERLQTTTVNVKKVNHLWWLTYILLQILDAP